MTRKVDKTKDVLHRSRSASTDIFCASVITTGGFVAASESLSEIDEGLVGGITAALLKVGERTALEMMNSKMKQVFVKSEKGYIICETKTDGTVLLSLVNPEAKQGLIFLEIRRVVPELMELV